MTFSIQNEKMQKFLISMHDFPLCFIDILPFLIMQVYDPESPEWEDPKKKKSEEEERAFSIKLSTPDLHVLPALNTK